MWKKIFEIIKNDRVFSIAAVLTVFSMLAVPPSKEYAAYINYSVLALLFCLMAVVQGLKKQGVFDVAAAAILSTTRNARTIGILLMSICFFSAMLVTNDVALLTFVPLTFILFGDTHEEGEVIFIVVMETIAANLGSMVTPIGNPQNLLLYYQSGMSVGDFLAAVLPFGLAGYGLLFCTMWFRLKHAGANAGSGARLEVQVRQEGIGDYRFLLLHGFLFLLCLMTVLKCVDYRVCFPATLVLLFIADRKVLAKVDYMLLATFLCFFIFVGNVSSIDMVSRLVSKLVEGRVLLMGAVLSQIISNVPAAAMLSGFTQDYKALLVGVNIGGLGTLAASLASLISYKLFAKAKPGQVGRYIKVFTVYNIGYLLILLVFAMCIC